MLKIGVLGASYIAETAIIEPARTLDTVAIEAVAARTLDKARDFAKKNNIAKAYQGYEKLLSDPDITTIYNCLPPALHAAWTIKSLIAGKDVICEKPIAMNTDEAKSMVQTAEDHNRRLVEAFHTAYHPGFTACQNWIKEGKIGSLKTLDAYFTVLLKDDGMKNQFRPEMGGGSVMDLGCYPLHWVHTIANSNITTINAQAVMTLSGVDTQMDATLTYMNDTVATIHCCMTHPDHFSAGLEITGTEGSIEFNNPLVPHNGSTLILKNQNGTESYPLSTDSTYLCQLRAIATAFLENTPLPTEGPAIIKQQNLIDQVYEAASLKSLRWNASSITSS